MNAIVAGSALLIAAFLNLQPFIRKLLEFPPPHAASPLATIALLCFTLVHGRARLGVRGLSVLLVGTFGVTFFMEALSMATGLVGDYEYTDALGPKVLGVPVLIPGAWLMMLYPTLLTVETILDAPPVRRVREQHGLGRALAWCAIVSLLVGMAMTAWDVGVETIIAVTGEYTWKERGGYFGIPIPNFVSWVITSSVAAFAFLSWELTAPARKPPSTMAPEWQPIAAYLVVFLVTFFGNLAHGNRAATVVTVFVMMPYLLLATARLLQRRIAATAVQ
jgi:uncharacterized membrane protein